AAEDQVPRHGPALGVAELRTSQGREQPPLGRRSALAVLGRYANAPPDRKALPWAHATCVPASRAPGVRDQVAVAGAAAPDLVLELELQLPALEGLDVAQVDRLAWRAVQLQ